MEASARTLTRARTFNAKTKPVLRKLQKAEQFAFKVLTREGRLPLIIAVLVVVISGSLLWPLLVTRQWSLESANEKCRENFDANVNVTLARHPHFSPVVEAVTGSFENELYDVRVSLR
jgi:hypothetical protein